jgi:hypothetical protein
MKMVAQATTGFFHRKVCGDREPSVAQFGQSGDQAGDMRLTQVRGERLVVPPLLDRDKAERVGDLGVVAVVEAAVVAA